MRIDPWCVCRATDSVSEPLCRLTVVCLFICLFVYLSVCLLFVYLSVCLLFVALSVCLPVCLSVSSPFFVSIDQSVH